jgi:hypothetical protein
MEYPNSVSNPEHTYVPYPGGVQPTFPNPYIPYPNFPINPYPDLFSPTTITTTSDAMIWGVEDEDSPEYKFSEGRLLQELQDYINETYRSSHYSRNKFQATEFILDSGHGVGFCVGNILKYSQRYGKKDGYNRKDILKVLHYALILLHTHDLEQNPCKDIDVSKVGGLLENLTLTPENSDG